MGMDIELFEDEVPTDLVCGECRKVVAHPVLSTCPHLFCAACLKRRLRRPQEKTVHTCPTCNTPLTKDVMEPPPVPVKVRLLNLRIRCSHGCGKVFPLADLADHLADECPQALVTCPLRCPIKVKRAEVDRHVQTVCEHREVQCEACGHRTLLAHLSTHQSQKRCVEKKLRRQFIKASKLTSIELRQHWENLQRQHIRLEQQQRQRILQHYRHTTATIAPKGKFRQPPERTSTTSTRTLNSPDSSNNNNASPYNSPRSLAVPPLVLPGSLSNDEPALDRPSASADVFMTSPRRFRQHRSGNITHRNLGDVSQTGSAQNSPHWSDNLTVRSRGDVSQTGSAYTSPRRGENLTLKSRGDVGQTGSAYTTSPRRAPASALEGEVSQRQGNDVDVFLTSSGLAEDDVDDGEMTLTLNSPSSPGMRLPTVVICKNCKKPFRESRNTANACRWHPGLETCYACGRLDYQKGCMMGFHEL